VLGHVYASTFILPAANILYFFEHVSNECLIIFKHMKNENKQYIWCCVLIVLMLFRASKYSTKYTHQIVCTPLHVSTSKISSPWRFFPAVLMTHSRLKHVDMHSRVLEYKLFVFSWFQSNL
jgi:hypothetical protein